MICDIFFCQATWSRIHLQLKQQLLFILCTELLSFLDMQGVRKQCLNISWKLGKSGQKATNLINEVAAFCDPPLCVYRITSQAGRQWRFKRIDYLYDTDHTNVLSIQMLGQANTKCCRFSWQIDIHYFKIKR